MANWYNMLKESMEQNGDRIEDCGCEMDEKSGSFVAYSDRFVYIPAIAEGKKIIAWWDRTNPEYFETE